MSKRSVTSIAPVITMVLLGLLASPAAGDDWPRWRGPAGNGISTETNWDPQALANGARILWKAEIGMGHSAIAVKDGRLYIMGNRKVTNGPAAGAFEDTVYCLDASNGREIWRYSFPCKEGQDPGPGSSPVLDGDTLYTFSREGQLISFNAVDGSIRWRRDLTAEAAPEWGFSGSPLIEGDMVLLDAGRSGYAVDKQSGKVLWASQLEQCGFATPVVFSSGDKRLAAIAAHRQVYVVDTANGELQWSHRGQCLNDPIIIGDRMLLTGTQRAEMVSISDNGEPEVVWRQRDLMSHYTTPVIFGDFMYGIGRTRSTGYLQCAEVSTGELKWQQDIGPWGALIGAAGKLIVIDDSGQLLIVEATPEEYRPIAIAKVLDMADNTGIGNRRQCHCWTAPTLANGLVYVRNTYGEMACVDMR
jgi:outer membrane protein assembly factor BamB